ncbi:MAG TPA: VIT family protein [Acidimicrobiia bacterium]
MPVRIHRERHRSDRGGWLRAAVLGAQDGIVTTASVLVGVAAADVSRSVIITTGVSLLVAGALSMASGEYSSVSSQRDAEIADIDREERELATAPEHELEELTQIYEERGLSRDLAHRVAVELMEHDPLGSHVRDELGLHEGNIARPAQAAVASATSYALGSALAIIAAVTAPSNARVAVLAVSTLALLVATGWTAARLAGSGPLRPVVRVVVLGGIALLVTGVIGAVVGAHT